MKCYNCGDDACAKERNKYYCKECFIAMEKKWAEDHKGETDYY